MGRNPGSLLRIVQKTQIEADDDDSSDSSDDDEKEIEEDNSFPKETINAQNSSTQQKPSRFVPVKLVHHLSGGRWTGQDKTPEPGYQIPNASREMMIRRVRREIKQRPATAKSRTDIKKMIASPSYQMCSVFTLLPEFAKPVQLEDKSRVTSPVQPHPSISHEDLGENGRIISNFFDQMKARTLSIISEHGKEVKKLRETIEFQEKAIEIMKSFMTDEQKIQFTKHLSELESRTRETSLSTQPPTPTGILLSGRHDLLSESSLSSEEVFSPLISPRANVNSPKFLQHQQQQQTTNPQKQQHN